jgi:hypothetical protein
MHIKIKIIIIIILRSNSVTSQNGQLNIFLKNDQNNNILIKKNLSKKINKFLTLVFTKFYLGSNKLDRVNYFFSFFLNPDWFMPRDDLASGQLVKTNLGFLTRVIILLLI